ncbi:hypothetical protein PROFUN_03951 [Planoprotostelium fungivorum]|uniref:Uncharacterized protein n=1 Tax=Planoprotostelium fungivorum TaxID=1890364 RepID=A0A2P6MTS1_9EUKA|nr:hypothetical protein PROFUN_03951 [Planoprotostelium fungivorum]
MRSFGPYECVILCLLLVPSLSLECQNGEEFCGCPVLWEGERCQKMWNEDQHWMRYVTLYQFISTTLFGILFIWPTFEIVKIILNSDTQRARNIAMYGLSLSSISSFLRCLSMAVDPHGIRGIVPVKVFRVLTSTIVFMWISIGFGVCLYWMEICKYINTDGDSRFVKRLRPILYVLIVAVWGSLFVCSLSQATMSDVTADAISYTVTFGWFFIFLVISIIYGLNLRSQLKPLRSPEAVLMRKRIANYLIMLGISFSMEVFDHVLLVKYRWMFFKETYLLMQSLNRVADAIPIVAWVLLFRKSYNQNQVTNNVRSTASIRSVTQSYNYSASISSSREVLGDSYSQSAMDDDGDLKEE